MGENRREIAIVFGLFETGLGVIRSLARKGIKVYGIDHKKDIAFYSKYVTPLICPNPIYEQQSFISWLNNNFENVKGKIPVFITSDDFLISISEKRTLLNQKFLLNQVSHESLKKISDKYLQYKLAVGAGIKAPKTWLIENEDNILSLKKNTIWPLFIKGKDVNTWRNLFGGGKKGFVVNDYNSLSEKSLYALKNNVSVIIQEIVLGPDTNHFKYCAYITGDGTVLAEICIQKIRQYPVRFGVGSAVTTVQNQQVMDAGRKFFKNIKFKGIGSAEFKYDDREKAFKLIELNPRYWQQNSIGEKSGLNFPFINYCDLMNIQLEHQKVKFKKVIWVNIYSDFSSFIRYRKEGLLTFRDWRKSLRGEKIYSDFAWDDPLPSLFELRFGLKLFKLPKFLFKNLFFREV